MKNKEFKDRSSRFSENQECMNTFTSEGDGNGEAGEDESVEEMGEIK